MESLCDQVGTAITQQNKSVQIRFSRPSIVGKLSSSSQNQSVFRIKIFDVKTCLLYCSSDYSQSNITQLPFLNYCCGQHYLSQNISLPTLPSRSTSPHFLYFDYNPTLAMHQVPLSSIALNSLTLHYFSNASSLTHYTKDIVSGEYEGGFKLWECTLDMLNFMQTIPQVFEQKRVLQIGCGHGLLGILASKLNASHICLQDYNGEVIEKLTRPTVQINKEPLQKFSFFWGDWQQLKCTGKKFDVIIGCELIYNQQNYQKLVHIIMQFMSEEGCCILGNKVYYFGVGGNMPAFKKCVQSSTLKCESLLKVSPPTGGNKKQIVKITF